MSIQLVKRTLSENWRREQGCRTEVDTNFLPMVFGGIDNLERQPKAFMSPLALLLRCLLIVTLCLDGSLSLWSSSAMALHEVQQAVDSGTQTALAADEDCEEGAAAAERGSHEDCDCGSGSACGCACVFPVAAITHPLPFMAQHALTSQPAPLSLAAEPSSTITPVFRPPIG